MRIDVPADLADLGRIGEEIYIVGGAVRDALTGVQPSDYDLAGPKRPVELTAARVPGMQIEGSLNGLGTGRLVWKFGSYEYTAFRKDSYGRNGEHRPNDVVFYVDMQTDALRRDFTINALYATLPDGNVLDPTGKGMEDLNDRMLRMTRDETLAEDALRILRMVRIAATYGFNVEPKTWEAAKATVNQLEQISRERILEEFLKILGADMISGRREGVRTGLYMLRDLGALSYICPELMAGHGMEQSPKFHRYDVLDHQIETCAQTPPDLVTRMAALLHDIAKPEVFAQNGNMHGHDKTGAERAEEILQRLKAPKQFIQDVCALVRLHMFDLDNTAKKKTVLKRLNRLGKEQFERLCDLREADFAGSGMGAVPKSAFKWRRIVEELDAQDAPFTARALAVNGEDIMRELELEPGPAIGEVQRALLEYAQMRPRQNNYKSLIKYAKIWLTGMQVAHQSSSDRIYMEDTAGV